MIILYNIAIQLMHAGIRLASLFHPKAKAFVTGRHKLFQEIETRFQKETDPVIWMHCASLGEFEQGRPVIEALKREFRNHKILLTFFSPSGFEVRKNYPLADHVCYLPFESKQNAQRFIKAVRPVAAIFVKYEFWFHYAHALHQRNIPLLSISSIFREKQIFFKSYGSVQRKTLKFFTHFFVQNLTSVSLLKSIGITNVTQVGDTRFDRVVEIAKKGEPIPVAEKFKNKQKVMVVGSSWPQDIDVLLPFINQNRLKFIIAPHEISETNLKEIERALQIPYVRFSHAEEKSLEDISVLLIDNVGMLSRLYRYGEFAYIGGGFGKGLHNILEAACYGIPVIFGHSNYEKFQEAADLINRGGAFAVKDYNDLLEKYEILNVPETFQLACEVTRQYVEDNLGATDRIINYIKKSVIKKQTTTVL